MERMKNKIQNKVEHRHVQCDHKNIHYCRRCEMAYCPNPTCRKQWPDQKTFLETFTVENIKKDPYCPPNFMQEIDEEIKGNS